MTDPVMNRHERHGGATDLPGEVLRAPSGYPITEKMRWRTPGYLYRTLDQEFHFDLDATAEDCRCLAKRWLTHEEDALTVDWRFTFRQRIGGEVSRIELEPDEPSPIRAAFTNPPWSARQVPDWVRKQHPDLSWVAFPGTDRFLRRGWEMSRVGVTVAALIPQAFDAEWFKPLVVLADEVRVGRRFRFLTHLGKEGPQPPGGHALIVYRPHVPEAGWPGGPRVTWDWNPRPE